MGFQFNASSYILTPNFYNAIIEDITPKTTMYGPAYEFRFAILDNVLLKKQVNDQDKYSLGKVVRKTFGAKAILPNGDLDFAPTGEYRNTVEMLVKSNNLNIEEVAKSEKKLLGCVCRIIVVNSSPDKNGAIWNNVQKAGILEPDQTTFSLINNYKVWKSQQPVYVQGANQAQPVQQPQQFVQPQPQQFVQPVDPFQPVAQPVQPVAQPVQPFQPVAQPVQPVAQPVQPVQPVAQPVQPVTQPVQPVQPIQPPPSTGILDDSKLFS